MNFVVLAGDVSVKEEATPGGGPDEDSATDAGAAAVGVAVDDDGDVEMERGTKRPHSGAGSDGGADNASRRRKKKKKMPGPPLPKNALMQLNEIKPGLVYNLVSQSGESALSLFGNTPYYRVRFKVL